MGSPDFVVGSVAHSTGDQLPALRCRAIIDVGAYRKVADFWDVSRCGRGRVVALNRVSATELDDRWALDGAELGRGRTSIAIPAPGRLKFRDAHIGSPFTGRLHVNSLVPPRLCSQKS